jgi:hypothetical protein
MLRTDGEGGHCNFYLWLCMGVKVCHGKDTVHFGNKILRFIFGFEITEMT